MAEVDVRRIRLMNHLILITLVIFPILSILDIANGIYITSAFYFGGYVIAFAEHWLVKKRKYTFSKYLIYFLFLFLGILMLVCIGSLSNISILVPLAMVPLLIFNDRIVSFILFIILLLCFLLTYYLIENVQPVIVLEERVIPFYTVVGAVFAAVIIYLFSRYNRSVNESYEKIILRNNEEISLMYKSLTDSINYALRIQTAILPSNKIIKQSLENSFILYKPKDIVAGDFYWMENVDDLVLFAACDCTGHGVPGAMVSVVCFNALNNAVREFGLKQPAAILDKAAEIVIENFSKSEDDIQDGMDISIAALNTKTMTLEWAGANNSLLLIENGQLQEIKADKQCIGHNDLLKPFTNHQFKLHPNTSIYLFTDGFADQFGGQHEKKLTKNRFRELLLSIQNIPICEQAKELDDFIMNYKGDVEQTDDILVMGVRV